MLSIFALVPVAAIIVAEMREVLLSLSLLLSVLLLWVEMQR